MNPRRVVIVGVGGSGLATAHRHLELAETKGAAVEPIVREVSDAPGGVIRTHRAAGVSCSRTAPKTSSRASPRGPRLSVASAWAIS